jgi:hypothetical protein
MSDKSCEFIPDLKAWRKASKQLECKVTHLQSDQIKGHIICCKALHGILSADSSLLCLLADVFLGIEAVKYKIHMTKYI